MTEVDSGHSGGGARVGEGHLLNETFSLPVKHIIVHNTDNEACLRVGGLEGQCEDREPTIHLIRSINVVVPNNCRGKNIII